MQQPVAFIPSPSQGVWHLGPLPIRAYALMIIIGIVIAVWLGERRWTARGGTPGLVIDVSIWAVTFGLVGGRLYHVVTDYQRYFGSGKDPVDAFKVWQGGLGIWGAILLGGVGAAIACRRRGVSVLALGDAVAPGIALAQAVGRWGNYWNQELYGRELHTWWAIKIDPAHRPQLAGGGIDPKYENVATYHPTFLYESLWCIGVAIVVIWAGRRFKLTHGRTFALYIALYTLGRFWIEALRIDEAHHILGLRLNDWTSLIVFAGAVAFLYVNRGKTGPEAVTLPVGVPEEDEPAKIKVAAGTATAAESADASADLPDEPETPDEPEPAEEAVAAADLAEEPEPEESVTDVAEEPEAAAAEVAEESPAEPEPEPEPEHEHEHEAVAEPAEAEEPVAEEPAAAGEPESEPEEPVAEPEEPVAEAAEPVAEPVEAEAPADVAEELDETEAPTAPVEPEAAAEPEVADEPEAAAEPEPAEEPEVAAEVPAAAPEDDAAEPEEPAAEPEPAATSEDDATEPEKPATVDPEPAEEPPAAEAPAEGETAEVDEPADDTAGDEAAEKPAKSAKDA